jgi:hypothetical protein
MTFHFLDGNRPGIHNDLLPVSRVKKLSDDSFATC